MQLLVRQAACVVLVLALAGCSAPERAEEKAARASGDTAAVQPAPAAPVAAPVVPPAPPADAGATDGGDGSAIRLSALSAAEVEGGRLAGELGCSFSTNEATPLLVAKGNVASTDRAWGLVKVGDCVEPVSAPGGFDGMLKGATFAGQGKTVRIAVTGPATAGGESPAKPATLTYDRADGARRTFAGRWECGP